MYITKIKHASTKQKQVNLSVIENAKLKKLKAVVSEA